LTEIRVNYTAGLASKRIILGVDPGTSIMGYGLIRVMDKNPAILTYGIIHLSKYQDNMVKLRKIFERSLKLIEEYKPDELAIEAPFFGKNVQSMLKLGRAQGVAMAAGLYRDVPIFEYAPRKIKQSITGNGNASKEQVAGMIGSLLDLTEIPQHLDATDGLAAALCHFFQNDADNAQEGKKYNSWQSFIKDNPDKIR